MDIGRGFYLIGFGLLRGLLAIALFRCKPMAWPRNSFLTDAFRPFRSDLDVTLVLKQRPNGFERSALRWIDRVVKLVFPYLGEMNCYVESEFEAVALAINPFELRRDPRLHELFRRNGWERPPTPALAAAFLTRMLASDFRNLRSKPASRTQKWNIHIRDVKECLFSESLGPLTEDVHKILIFDPFEPVRSVLRAVLWLNWRVDLPSMVDEAQAWFQAYFDLHPRGGGRGGVDLEPAYVPLLDTQPWWWAFWPQRVCRAQRPIKAFHPPLFPLLLAQLEWELFALLSQRHSAGDWPGKVAYLEVLKTVARRISEAYSLESGAELQSLLSRMDRLEA